MFRAAEHLSNHTSPMVKHCKETQHSLKQTRFQILAQAPDLETNKELWLKRHEYHWICRLGTLNKLSNKGLNKMPYDPIFHSNPKPWGTPVHSASDPRPPLSINIKILNVKFAPGVIGLLKGSCPAHQKLRNTNKPSTRPLVHPPQSNTEDKQSHKYLFQTCISNPYRLHWATLSRDTDPDPAHNRRAPLMHWNHTHPTLNQIQPEKEYAKKTLTLN